MQQQKLISSILLMFFTLSLSYAQSSEQEPHKVSKVVDLLEACSDVYIVIKEAVVPSNVISKLGEIAKNGVAIHIATPNPVQIKTVDKSIVVRSIVDTSALPYSFMIIDEKYFCYGSFNDPTMFIIQIDSGELLEQYNEAFMTVWQGAQEEDSPIEHPKKSLLPKVPLPNLPKTVEGAALEVIDILTF